MMKLQEYLNLKDKANGAIFPQLIVSHKNCPDGSAVVVLAKKIFPHIKYVMATHERINREILDLATQIEQGGKLFIADIAPAMEHLIELWKITSAKAITVNIYDHHQTTTWLKTIEIPPEGENHIIFKEDSCAAKIFYDHHLPHHPELRAYEEFICYTNDRDLWLKQYPQGDELALLHGVLGDANYIKRFCDNPDATLTHDEKIIINFTKQQAYLREERFLKTMKIYTDEKRYPYGIVYGDGNSSDLLNKALQRHELEYAFLVNLNTKRVSMRGRGNVDCAKYAAKRGGGGHRKASGFSINFQEPLL